MKNNGDVLTLIFSVAHKLHEKEKDFSLCKNYARWLVEYVMGKDCAELMGTSTIKMRQEQKVLLDRCIQEFVLQSKPFSYIMGTVPFCDLSLIVEPPFLIPRKETEQWVTELIQRLQPYITKDFTILDIGTGSGCIALSLAHAFPLIQVYALDISENALALACRNSKKNNINNVTFINSDLFNSLQKKRTFDLIVSNPPYIAQSEWDDLDPSVRLWEDRRSLCASQEGMEVIEKIITQAGEYLRIPKKESPLPQLVIEIGYRQRECVMRILGEQGYRYMKVKKDYAGKDRIVEVYMEMVV